MECRYCFDEKELIFPCACTAGICKECLNEWLLKPPYKHHCEICLQEWDKKHLSMKNKCGPYYSCFSWTIFTISLYVCLLCSFILCNMSMDTNILKKYAVLEAIFHGLVAITCSVFPKEMWLRLWGILRISFTGWPTLYLLNEWLNLTTYNTPTFWMRTLFKQWEIMAAIQCLYIIIVPVIFLKNQNRRPQGWNAMPIEVM